jgi:S-adenosylmethionine/arginine decarboxylase-like enzyme/SAM-dependent methyltransferase
MRSPRFHVLFDLDHCRDTIRDPAAIERFIRETITSIGMRVVGGPLVCEGVPQNPGLSGFAVLDFSHISVHTFTRYAEAMIDVFSCKSFDRSTIRRHVLAAFATPKSTIRAEVVHWEDGAFFRTPAREVDYLSTYMDEYYGFLNEENIMIGTFLQRSTREAAQENGGGVRLLDVGCGPSLFYWAAFQPDVSEFHGMDAREENVAYVRQVVARTAAGDIEPRYEHIAEHLAPGENGRARQRLREQASRVVSILPHDLTKPWPYSDGSFEVVQSCFGVDHVETQEEMTFALSEAWRVLRPGGRLTLVTLGETSRWVCGGVTCACLYTTSVALQSDLERVGLRVISLDERPAVVAAAQKQGYEKMIFCRAVRDDTSVAELRTTER